MSTSIRVNLVRIDALPPGTVTFSRQPMPSSSRAIASRFAVLITLMIHILPGSFLKKKVPGKKGILAPQCILRSRLQGDPEQGRSDDGPHRDVGHDLRPLGGLAVALGDVAVAHRGVVLVVLDI